NSGWKCSGSKCICDGQTNSTCSRHATNTTSIILGDYTGGQADGLFEGDHTCPGGCRHSPKFKNQATGMAPEASLMFWGQMASCQAPDSNPCQEDALANSFTQSLPSAIGAAQRHVDISNNSWIWRDSQTPCNPIPVRSFELEMENAFDDGIFVA